MASDISHGVYSAIFIGQSDLEFQKLSLREPHTNRLPAQRYIRGFFFANYLIIINISKAEVLDTLKTRLGETAFHNQVGKYVEQVLSMRRLVVICVLPDGRLMHVVETEQCSEVLPADSIILGFIGDDGLLREVDSRQAEALSAYAQQLSYGRG
jgi:hypothetical protein